MSDFKSPQRLCHFLDLTAPSPSPPKAGLCGRKVGCLEQRGTPEARVSWLRWVQGGGTLGGWRGASGMLL